jgi:probable rRNA maturation factor
MQEDLISFFSEDINFDLAQSDLYSIWLQKLIKTYNKITGDISYIFCSDEYLHKLNVEHLNHDTLTDIITFDYTHAGIISGDIFISIDRIKENSNSFSVTFEQELTRVMAHGVLHLIGFKDKKQEEKDEMRTVEDKAISLFHLDL